MNGPRPGPERALWLHPSALRDTSARGWQDLGALAAREGLGGLLYARCTAAGVPMPPPLLACWRQEYRRTAAANLVGLRSLGAALPALGERGLSPVLMPGAALLPLYPDPGCRPMDDLDLLARPEDLAGVREVMRGLGFAAVPRHPDLLVRGDTQLDLHGDLLNASRIGARRWAGRMDADEVRRDGRQAVVEGVAVRVMSSEDALIYTAAHALRHGYARLTWFVDLQLLIGSGLDWVQVADKAERYGLGRSLAYGLRYLQEQAGIELPGPARELAAGVRLGAVERVLLRQAWRESGRGQWGDLLWACSVGGLARRFRFLAETSFPRPAVMLQVFPFLPRPLFPLAYGLRVGQLLWRGGRQAILLTRGGRAFGR